MNTAPEGLQHPPGHVHAPRELGCSVVGAPRGHSCPVPLLLPQLALLAFTAAQFKRRGEHRTPRWCCEVQSSETCVCGKTWAFEIGHQWGCSVPVSLR